MTVVPAVVGPLGTMPKHHENTGVSGNPWKD